MYRSSVDPQLSALFMSMLFLSVVIAGVIGMALCATGRVVAIVAGLGLITLPMAYYIYFACNGRLWF